MVAFPSAPVNQNLPSAVSVLFCAPGHGAAKTWRRGEDGLPKAQGFSAGWLFAIRSYPVASVRDLGALVGWAIPQEHAFLTRYEPVPGLDLAGVHRRLARGRPDAAPSLRERPGGLPWIALDVDGLELPFDADLARDPEAVVRHVVSLLPACFRDVTVLWTLTSSAGMASNPRVVSLRLFYWLDRAISDEDAKTLVKSFALEIDPCVFHPAQAIYVAAPRFEDGLVDPIPRRWGLAEGRTEFATVPAIVRPLRPVSSGKVLQSGGETFDDWMRKLGDGPGLAGFYWPLLQGTWAYVANGGKDFDGLKRTIRERAAQAPRKSSRSEDVVENYVSDETLDHYLEGAIEKIEETRQPVERERLEALAKAWKGKRSNEGVAERGRLLDLVMKGLRIDEAQARNVARALGRQYAHDGDPHELAQHFIRSLPRDVTMADIAQEIEEAQAGTHAVKNPDGWVGELRRGTVGFGENERQVVLPTTENVMTIAAKHPAWSGRIAFDEFLNAASIVNPPPWHPTDRPQNVQPGPWSDEDNTRFVAWIGREVNVTVPDAVAYKAVLAHAQTNKYHPIRSWLSGLRHDGQERLDGWLSKYLGVEDSEYARDVGWWFLIGAVARIHEPGCKLDTMPVLESEQGFKKSTALKKLFGARNHRDTPIDFMSKDRFIQLQGAWCYEIAELDGMDRAEVDRVKSFLSSADDAYRPPYGRTSVKIPRSLVFAGTVNRDDYLRDETGNRRFLPIKCGDIDIDGLEAVRDQLWAEAVQAYYAGCRWWAHTTEEKRRCKAEQSRRLQHDVWGDEILAFLVRQKRPWTTVGDCLYYALNMMDKAKWSRTDQMRVSRSLVILGWARVQVRDEMSGEKVWRYYPGGAE